MSPPSLQNWSLVALQWIWSLVCQPTSFSCVWDMQTTSMMTRKSALCSPQPSTVLRRSWRCVYACVRVHVCVPFCVTPVLSGKKKVTTVEILKGGQCFVMSLCSMFDLQNVYYRVGSLIAVFFFLSEKRRWLWDRLLLAVQHLPLLALSETIQWWSGKIDSSWKTVSTHL